MTDAERRAALVEKVAKAICTVREQNGGPPWDYLMTMGKHVTGSVYEEATAALTVALEEAAKECDEMVREQVQMTDWAYRMKPEYRAGLQAGFKLAAAIRALIPSGSSSSSS